MLGRRLIAILLIPVLAQAKDGIVVLQFDDGRQSQYAEAFPILERYGFAGSFGVITGIVGNPDQLTVPELQELHASGHEIHDHTWDHDPAFWGDPANAAAWRAAIQRSLDSLAAWGIDDVRGWNQPGGTGQGFSAALRDTLHLFYDYSAGRVGLNYLQNKNQHWNLRDDSMSLGRGGVYSWGYNVPAAALTRMGYNVASERDVARLLPVATSAAAWSAQAEVTEILKRMADGLAQGLVVIPLFHGVEQADSSAWGLEEICRAVSAWGVPVMRAADAYDAVTTPGDRRANLAPNPDFTLDRNLDGIVDGWLNAEPGGVVGNLATSTVYGPEVGATTLSFTVSSPTDDQVGLVLRYYHITGGVYTTSDQSFWFTSTQAPSEERFSVDVAPDVDRVLIEFLNVDNYLEISGLSWALSPQTPVAISGLVAGWNGKGVVLSWQMSDGTGLRGFHVVRDSDGRTDQRLTPNALPPTSREFVDVTARPGRAYGYVLLAITDDGADTRSPRVEFRVPLPATALCPNMPNPFNPSTTIRFSLAASGFVAIDIFSPSGAHIRSVVRASYAPGEWSTSWDGTDNEGRPVASGVYYCRMRAGNVIRSRKMVLVK